MNAGLRVSTPEGVIESVGEFTANVMGLAELQAKLAAVDAKEAIGVGVVPLALIGVAGAVILGALPVILIGLGFVLAAAFSIPQGVGLLIVGGIAAAIGGVVGFLAVRAFSTSFVSFRRSREELVRNLSWIKTVIAQSSRAVNRPGR